jgi:hypothetical protein
MGGLLCVHDPRQMGDQTRMSWAELRPRRANRLAPGPRGRAGSRDDTDGRHPDRRGQRGRLMMRDPGRLCKQIRLMTGNWWSSWARVS